MKHEGQCHCGKITIESELDPMLTYTCGCNSCRRKGGSVGARVMYAQDEVKIKGSTKEYIYEGGSGGKIYSQHCENCFTLTHATFDYMEGMVALPIGMFDKAKDFKPRLEIWTSEKLDWLKDDGCIVNKVEDSGVKERLVELLEKIENR